MTQLIKNMSAFVGFGFVAFMHVYFVLLLMAKPALAEEKTQNVVVETSASGASVTTTAPADARDTTDKSDAEEPREVLKNLGSKQFNFKINDEKGTIKIDKNGIQISQTDSDDKEDMPNVMSSFKNLNKTNQWVDVLEDVLVPIVLFLSAFGFAGYFVYAKSRTRRDYLETIKALAQSGQPIPQELLNSLNSTMGGGKVLSPNKNQFDTNAIQGVKYIFWGIGFIGCMILLEQVGFIAAVGFVFITMGAFHIYTTQNMQKPKTADTVATTSPETK